MARRAVGKKMPGLAGVTADAAGRAEALRGEVQGWGHAGGRVGGKARLRGLHLFSKVCGLHGSLEPGK